MEIRIKRKNLKNNLKNNYITPSLIDNVSNLDLKTKIVVIYYENHNNYDKKVNTKRHVKTSW